MKRKSMYDIVYDFCCLLYSRVSPSFNLHDIGSLRVELISESTISEYGWDLCLWTTSEKWELSDEEYKIFAVDIFRNPMPKIIKNSAGIA